ncbi:MAG: hypothetical protein JWQ87_2695 [Candidatus Sulfotelmatobacter sp.]|nr:hypothetical protein [Candidatus Sulfotelmatobacter sp.]
MQRLSHGLVVSLLTCSLVSATANLALAQSNQPAASSMPKVGAVAPDFKMSYFDGNDLKEVSLSQYHGKKNVVLAFFIFAFTGG